MKELVAITQEEKLANGWEFTVTVGEGDDQTQHTVRLDKPYWKELTGGRQEPGQLAVASFEFLLARERKESILHQFNLRQISHYFPEYEEAITKGGR